MDEACLARKDGGILTLETENPELTLKRDSVVLIATVDLTEVAVLAPQTNSPRSPAK